MQCAIDASRRSCRPWRALPGFLVLLCLAASGCGSDPAERRGSIYALKADPTARNVQLIRERLADPDRDVRATVLNALVELEVADAAQLVQGALDDPDGFVRATAAKLLGDLDRSSLVPALARVLAQDPDPVVRQRAAESLARLGGPSALEALSYALVDPIERVRGAVVEALGDLDPGFAVEALIELLQTDGVWEIRAQAAQALGQSGDPAAAVALNEALSDPNEFVRSAVANALKVHAKVRAKAERDEEGSGV